MRRCLDLATNGTGHTAPNPLVGAVIVHNDRIIGEGYHSGYGNAHAEVEAVNSVTDPDKHLLPESILYVNLEPCSHHGKTPPCTDLILRTGIKTVVIGAADPNPIVDGKGIQVLRKNDINVTENILKEECISLNKRFYTYHQLKRPYVLLKWAQSLDNFITGNGHQRVQLSNSLSQVLVHKWRSEESAILVGYKTASIDNPNLTVRNWKGKNPLRVVYDPNLELPKTLNIFNGAAETWIINTELEKVEGNISFKKVSASNWVQQTLEYLWYANRLSVMVEGGTHTLQTFIHQGVWDEARVFITSNILQNGLVAPALFSQHSAETIQVGDNTLNIYTRR